MTATLNDIASQIISTLRITDPELDTSTGTTARKIIDAVAESIAEAYIDQHLLTYQYDIDAKVDADLDDFVQLFGMARLAAKRASGTVVFTRTTGLSYLVSIPINTQIASNTNPQVIVQTVTGAFLEPGSSAVTVPVQAVEAGAAGNVPSATLVAIRTPVDGVSAVTNISPLTGGTAQETDAQLRDRWKKTVFRSLAGTEQMYLGVALDDVDCYAANVVGASKRRREQVQIVSGEAETTVDDVRVTYAEPVFVGPNVDAGDINIKDADYSWNVSVNPPRVDVIDAAKMPDGSIIEVDFEYEPTASRNDVENGITNRVDVWVGGQRAISASQVITFRTTIVFTNTSTDVLYAGNFARTSGEAPDVANIFVPLAFGPVVTVPDTLTIGGQIYALATPDKPLGFEETVGADTIFYAYRIVHQDGAFGWTPTSLFGLEWDVTHAPANNSVFSIGETGEYTYNRMIADIQQAVDKWRLLGVDAKVHQAKQIALRFNFAIMYDRSANIAVVNTQIDTALASLLTQAGFLARLQVSDILQTVHNVAGVDNVRFLHGGDYSGYVGSTPEAYGVGIQQVADGAVVDTDLKYVDANGRPRDIYFGDSELPVFESAYKVLKAQNSFGVA